MPEGVRYGGLVIQKEDQAIYCNRTATGPVQASTQ